MIRLIGVVVPAHDEEGLIGSCLRSVHAAAAHPAVGAIPVRCITVLDRCRDSTGDRAVSAGATDIVEIEAANVGAARAAGIRRALAAGAGLAPEEVWLATTDADSVVPRHWLARQLFHAGRGADAVAGTVEIADWSQHPASTRRAFARHQRVLGIGPGHGHVHGANLGLSAAAYLDSDGIPPIVLSEDHTLWENLHAGGHRLVAAPDLAVVTSARREARAPGGFSSFLRTLASDAR